MQKVLALQMMLSYWLPPANMGLGSIKNGICMQFCARNIIINRMFIICIDAIEHARLLVNSFSNGQL